jgi:hypothetical protein
MVVWPNAKRKQPSPAIANSTFIHHAPSHLTGGWLLEEVSHDVSMSGRDSGPHWAWDRVLQLHEGGDEQRVLLALDQDFSLHPKAGAGNEEAKSGYCAGAGRCRVPIHGRCFVHPGRSSSLAS